MWLTHSTCMCHILSFICLWYGVVVVCNVVVVVGNVIVSPLAKLYLFDLFLLTCFIVFPGLVLFIHYFRSFSLIFIILVGWSVWFIVCVDISLASPDSIHILVLGYFVYLHLHMVFFIVIVIYFFFFCFCYTPPPPISVFICLDFVENYTNFQVKLYKICWIKF